MVKRSCKMISIKPANDCTTYPAESNSEAPNEVANGCFIACKSGQSEVSAAMMGILQHRESPSIS